MTLGERTPVSTRERNWRAAYNQMLQESTVAVAKLTNKGGRRTSKLVTDHLAMRAALVRFEEWNHDFLPDGSCISQGTMEGLSVTVSNRLSNGEVITTIDDARSRRQNGNGMTPPLKEETLISRLVYTRAIMMRR